MNTSVACKKLFSHYFLRFQQVFKFSEMRICFQGVKHYRDIRDLQNSINSICNCMILLYYFNLLTYYAEGPYMFVHTNGILYVTGQVGFIFIHTIF